ncbi:hypothetical protein [Candidatus Harpocratesius sp.]
MKKRSIIFITLFLFSIINLVTMNSLGFVKAEKIKDENTYGGYDFSQYYAPINSTLNYSLNTGDSLAYNGYSTYTIRNFNANNNLDTIEQHLHLNYSTFYQFNIIEYNSTLAYIQYDLFHLNNNSISNLTGSEPWTYISSKIRCITPIYKDISSEVVFPADVNSSDLLPNNTIPFLVEAKHLELHSNFSFYYDQIVSFVQNSLNVSVIYNDANNALYSGIWNIRGYSSTNQFINIQIEMSQKMGLTNENYLENLSIFFFEKVDISEPLNISSIEISHEVEFYGVLNLFYKGDLHLNIPEENSTFITTEWTTTESIDDTGDLDNWQNGHECEDDECHYESTHFFLFTTMLHTFRVLLGLIILFVIIKVIHRTSSVKQVYQNKNESISKNSQYSLYYKQDLKNENEIGILEKSPKSSDNTNIMNRFCPNCGRSISSVMAELLQREGYSFCEECGEKIEL